MRILQLAPHFPYPKDDGGRIGIANITRELSIHGHDVTFVSFAERMPDPSILEEPGSYSRPEFIFHSTRNTPLRIAASCLLDRSIYLAKHDGAKARSSLRKLLAANNYDVIHADHTAMMPLALFTKSIINKPVGLRLHNIEWMIWQRYADNLPRFSPKRLYIQRQADLLRVRESELIGMADVCFAITLQDLELAKKMNPAANILLASAGVNSDEWVPDTGIARNSDEIVLATTYKWVHNVDAVRWFIDNVLCLVRKEIPTAYWTLLGKEPPSWMTELSHEGVNALGYVDSVLPFLSRANVYAAPLFVGAGIRIKILEAMSMELPVVATPVSGDCINAGRENGLIIVDNAEDYAREIVRLMKEPELARSLGRKAREYVMNEFSWSRNVGIMSEAYERLQNNQ